MAQEQKIWCSPLTGKIFQGRVNTKTNIANKDKRDITDEAIKAVAEHLFYQPKVLKITLKSGDILSIKSTVTAQGVPDNTVENAAYDLLYVAERLVAQFSAAGIEPQEGSNDPGECLLAQAEKAIAKALGENNDA
ncbi:MULTISPECIES: DUF7446 family protein [Xenorhabdus]|uniref:DUF7446 family protein n=1 Tax=Xenorhabdus TaxID=626 RepID=UPI00064ACB6D|nr:MULTISPECIES: hypothetical protein [Xenorhabdus]KLU13894.1 hypothetical protein AAY47_19600 [Xenorhabdus griffiniae]KOP31893.1 hypothetical protein AFK69_18430 [Xenorhabdus sp. GDc328]